VENAMISSPATVIDTPPTGSINLGTSNEGENIWLSSAACASLPQFKSVYFASIEQQFAKIRPQDFSTEALIALDLYSLSDLAKIMQRCGNCMSSASVTTKQHVA